MAHANPEFALGRQDAGRDCGPTPRQRLHALEHAVRTNPASVPASEWVKLHLYRSQLQLIREHRAAVRRSPVTVTPVPSDEGPAMHGRPRAGERFIPPKPRYVRT